MFYELCMFLLSFIGFIAILCLSIITALTPIFLIDYIFADSRLFELLNKRCIRFFDDMENRDNQVSEEIDKLHK